MYADIYILFIITCMSSAIILRDLRMAYTCCSMNSNFTQCAGCLLNVSFHIVSNTGKLEMMLTNLNLPTV